MWGDESEEERSSGSLWLRELLSPAADFLSHGLHVCVCKEVKIQSMLVVWLYLTKCNSGVSFACEHGCSFPAPLGVQCNVKRHDPLTKLVVMGEGKGWKRVESVYLGPFTISWKVILNIEALHNNYTMFS